MIEEILDDDELLDEELEEDLEGWSDDQIARSCPPSGCASCEG